MRTFRGPSFVAAIATIVVTASGVTACGAGKGDDGPGDETVGTVGLELQLSSDVIIDTATYTITGPLGFTRTGSFDVSHSQTLSGVIPGIPVGQGYAITIDATSRGANATCRGSSAFNVLAHTTTPVNVHLTCHEGSHTGSIFVNGTLNICPLADGISANPAEVIVGGTIALSALAHDSDAGPSPLSYAWTATSGSFDHPTAKSPVFTCTAVGPATISVTVSDGDPATGCADSSAVTVQCSLPGTGSSRAVLTAAVYGDAPYGTTPTDTSQFVASPAFIDNVNADPDVSLVLHVGDIHSGKQFCTEAYDRSIFDLWTRFADPLVYIPGDNEWSDCHKVAQGGGQYNPATGNIDYVLDAGGNPVDYANGDPLANLALVRTIFYSHPGVALGGGAKQVFSQANLVDAAHPTDAEFVENVMWQDSSVVFVTVNIPGGSNNDNDIWYGAPTQTAAQAQEIVERTAAGLRWLDLAFAQAEATNAVAVVIESQADMWDPEKGAAHQAAYEPIVQSVASHTTHFGKPVMMFNGDSHVYLSHNPLDPADSLAFMHPGYNVPNFHRVVVHGSTLPLEWLKLVIDPAANAANGPNAFGPFSWTRVIP